MTIQADRTTSKDQEVCDRIDTGLEGFGYHQDPYEDFEEWAVWNAEIVDRELESGNCDLPIQCWHPDLA